MRPVTVFVCVALVASAADARARPVTAALAAPAMPTAITRPTPGAPAVKTRGPFGRTPARRAIAKVPVEDLPRSPPANVTLSLEAPSVRGPWVLRLTNDGDAPVRVVADARLLALDVTPLGAPKPRRCELPADMRPADVLERSLVLPPQRAYVETFEPLLYCFVGKSRDALSSGAIVVARLGRARPAEGAFAVVSPIDGVIPQVDERRFIDSPPIRLSDEPVPAPPRADPASDGAGLTLVSPETVDATTSDAIEIPLTLRNGGSRPLTVRFRPELLSFDVVRSSGTEHCSWPVITAAPLPELFTTLPARQGTAQLVVDLGAYCNGFALDRAGLVAVWAKLDTRTGSGQTIGIRSFDGQVAGRSPTFVRLHRGRAPEPLGVPHLADR